MLPKSQDFGYIILYKLIKTFIMNIEMHKAIKLMNDHQLSVVSTNTQINHGTIMVMDEMLGTNYTIHSTGYARKRVDGSYFDPLKKNHYQLNKVKRIQKVSTNGYHYQTTERILRPGEYQYLAIMVVRAANRERKYEMAEQSLRESGRTDSWFTNKELRAEYKKLTGKNFGR